MISQKKALFLGFGILFSALSLFFMLFQVDSIYHYDQYEQKIKSSFSLSGGIFTVTGSIENTKKGSSLILALDKSEFHEGDQFEIEWNIGGKLYTRELDREDSDETDRYYTFPLVTEFVGPISYEIKTERLVSSISLIHMSIQSSPRLVWRDFLPILQAETNGLHIISRSEWGADESLRYWSDTALAKEKSEWESRGRVPYTIYETAEDYHKRELDSRRSERIKDLRGQSAVVTSIKRYENGKKLLWPIKKTKIVDRIVIHHTAENLEQDADDATLLRAIYAYHARTRGWGDIGYNYIVGQRGQIYEGRAGGDYVEGAHAYANNLGSVGISVIGNFQVMNLNKDQRRGLEEAIVYFANKYGINIMGQTVGVRVCKTGGDCLFDENIVSRLLGHRDIGYTSCPGDHIYELLGEMRTRLTARIGSVVSVENTLPGQIDPVPGEDEVIYAFKNSNEPILTKPIATYKGGKPIKIKLSYPYSDFIVLSGPGYQKPTLRIGNKTIKGSLGQSMKIHTLPNNLLEVEIGEKTYRVKQVSYSADIVRIDSWTRTPSWDATGRYNDNKFRSKITLSNDSGKLLVVNELPLESYLKGLGEVSNSDLDEKIKTIIVAARSYARYYTDPNNRKYNTKLYDGSDDPDSFQRYLGYGYEERSPRVSDLVDVTRGEVITYSGKIIKAWYFSSSDGRTLSYDEYCKNSGSMNCMKYPYLQSVEDPGGVGKTRSGHGVGISGIGATYFAGEGWDYKKIIKYYMNGVEIKKK